MRTKPAIGQRVRALYGGDEKRFVVGTVTKLYPKHDDDWDEDTDEVIPGPLLPVHRWHACVEVEGNLPPWWPYGDDCPRFAPEIGDLTPL